MFVARGGAVVAPNIAQLVERSTVVVAGIEWSLVRFRVFGFFHLILELMHGTGHKYSVEDVASLV